PERLRAINMRLTDQEISFEQMESGAYRLKRRLLEEQQADQPLESHNRAKNYAVPSDSSFLVELGISSRSGDVKPDRYDKFRQLQKFVEIITDLIPESARSSTESLAVVDFGSGKHYLTFALHHILSQTLGDLKVTGVERREDLVLAGRSVANKLGLKSLEFINSSISQAELSGVDLVVALHACDTATDDAIARAIKADANYICVAPCCHQYVRQRMTPSTDLDALLRHGIILERFAEGLTDSLRVLALESHGYKTKLFEFISPEHTAKNVMITAVKTGRANQESAKTMQALKTKFDLKDFYLDTVLAKS
ncbi:MAG: class I SAM-dependent methyltransferase, partial [Pseudomonadota bacterium]